jgi:hypothetical protein
VPATPDLYPLRLVPTAARLSVIAAGLLVLGGLGSCTSFVSGMGEPADAALETALTVGVEGFQPSSAPTTPESICNSGGSGSAPQVDPELGDPASIAYTDGDAELNAWAWQASSPDAAAEIVDRAVAQADACENELYADYDTDGDGQFDSGSSTVTTTERVDADGWTGFAVRTEEDGEPSAESRYVRTDDVVVLVTLTGGGDTDPQAIVEDYLQAVGDRLG